jgi:hypothetical protein
LIEARGVHLVIDWENVVFVGLMSMSSSLRFCEKVDEPPSHADKPTLVQTERMIVIPGRLACEHVTPASQYIDENPDDAGQRVRVEIHGGNIADLVY